MCTLVLAWQVFEGTPVVATANRDEFLDRPSRPPAVVGEDPRVVAPRDEEAGGTWIGYNAHGLLVAITNRWAEVTGDRSRGLLVRDALRQPSAEEAARLVEHELDARAYAGFNLVLADASAAIYLEWDGNLGVRNFRPGAHVVVNVGADGEFWIPEDRQDEAERQAANAGKVATALQPEPGERSEEWLDRAADVISDHAYGVCVHREGENFGTCSSSLITLGEDGATYEFADGPPCETPYERVDSEI